VSASVLVLDDDRTVRETLVEFFETFLWTAVGVASAAEARAALARRAPDVLLLDLRLPDGDGLGFLAALRHEWPDVAVIVLTGHADVPTAVRAMQRGAVDLLEKPVDLDVLAATVRRAVALSRLQHEVTVLRARTRAVPSSRVATLAPGIEMAVRQAAASDGPVLVLGEPGSGRGFLARLIHEWSPRSAHAFVDLDCSAVSTKSFGVELCGSSDRMGGRRDLRARGLLDVAGDGSVLLERVECLDQESRVTVERLLQDKHFRRVGGGSERSNARLLLTETVPGAARDGPMASSPWAHLVPLVVSVPALRDRTTELPQLCRALLPAGARLSARAEHAVAAHRWPGNLRELEFTLWRAVLLAGDATIDVEHLGLPASPVMARPLADVERDAIRAALAAAGGNRSQAARLLGMSRSTLHLRLAHDALSDFRTDREVR
jgi:DNA-binding NtrC family response regulator